MSSTELMIALLSAGGATILAAVVNAFFNRRKLSAEATQIITQAAAGTVETIMKDNQNLRTELETVKATMVKLEGIVELSEQRERIHMITEERYRWHMQQWHRYAARLADEVRRLGGRVDEPPPEWPEPVQMVRTRPDAVNPDDQEL